MSERRYPPTAQHVLEAVKDDPASADAYAAAIEMFKCRIEKALDKAIKKRDKKERKKKR